MINQAILSLGYAVISRITLLAINLVAARMLLPEDYGFFSYLMITVASVAAMSSLGVGVTCNTVTAREYERSPDRVSATFTLSLIASVVLSIGLSVLFAWPMHSAAVGWSFLPLVGLILLLSLMMTTYGAIEGIFYGLGWQRQMALLALAVLIFALAATLGLIKWLGVGGAIAALLLHRMLALGSFGGQLLFKTNIRPGLSVLRRELAHARQAFLGVSLPLAFAAMMSGPVIAIAIGIVISGHGLASVAPFSFSYQFFLAATMIPNSTSSFLLSKFSDIKVDSAKLLRKSLFAMLAYGFVGALGMTTLVWIGPLISPRIVLPTNMLVHFSISILCYSLSTCFNAYWPALRKSIVLPLAQLFWGASIIAAVLHGSTDPETAISFGVMFGSIVQLSVHISAFVVISRQKMPTTVSVVVSKNQ